MIRRLLLLVLVSSCGRPATFAGPAPPGALRCALDHADRAGYLVVEGGLQERRVRVAQPIAGPDRDRPEGPPLDPVRMRPFESDDLVVENQILLQENDGRLLLTVIGINAEGTEVIPGSTATDLARTILSLCTSDPPVFPGSPEPAPERRRPGTPER